MVERDRVGGDRGRGGGSRRRRGTSVVELDAHPIPGDHVVDDRGPGSVLDHQPYPGGRRLAVEHGVVPQFEGAAVHQDHPGQVAVQVVVDCQEVLGVHAVEPVATVADRVVANYSVNGEGEVNTVATVEDGVVLDHSVEGVQQGDGIAAHQPSVVLAADVDSGDIDLAAGGVQFALYATLGVALDGVAPDLHPIATIDVDSHVGIGHLDVFDDHIVGLDAQTRGCSKWAGAGVNQAQAADHGAGSRRGHPEHRSRAAAVELRPTLTHQGDGRRELEVSPVAPSRNHHRVAGGRGGQSGSQLGTHLVGGVGGIVGVSSHGRHHGDRHGDQQCRDHCKAAFRFAACFFFHFLTVRLELNSLTTRVTIHEPKLARNAAAITRFRPRPVRASTSNW